MYPVNFKGKIMRITNEINEISGCQISCNSLSIQTTTTNSTAMKRWNKELLVLWGKMEGISAIVHTSQQLAQQRNLHTPSLSPRSHPFPHCASQNRGASAVPSHRLWCISPNFSYKLPCGSFTLFFGYGVLRAPLLWVK